MLPDPLAQEIVRYLSATRDCWWTARRIGAVIPRAVAEIERILETCWHDGLLRRKRGIGGKYEYQARSAEIS